MFDKYPYTDYHELNTDWIVGKIKDIDDSVIAAKASEDAAAQSASDAHDSELAAAQSASDAHDSELAAAGSASDAHDSELAAAGSVTDAQNVVSGTLNQINLLQARVDNIIPDGTQTAGNTELLDIRVAFDGRTYDSAGNAVRAQATENNRGINWANTGIIPIVASAVENGNIDSSGNNSGADAQYNLRLIDKFPIKSGMTINFTPGTDATHMRLYLYAADGTFIERKAWGTGMPYKFTADGYFRFTIKSGAAGTTEISPSDYDCTITVTTNIIEKIDKLENNNTQTNISRMIDFSETSLKKYSTEKLVFWDLERGGFSNSTGAKADVASTCRTKNIITGDGKTYRFVLPAGIRCKLYTYASDGTFETEGSWNSTTFSQLFDASKKYNIMYDTNVVNDVINTVDIYCVNDVYPYMQNTDIILNAVTQKLSFTKNSDNSLTINGSVDLFFFHNGATAKRYNNGGTFTINETVDNNYSLIWDLETNTLNSLANNDTSRPDHYVVLASNYRGVCQSGYFVKDYILSKIDERADIVKDNLDKEQLVYNLQRERSSRFEDAYDSLEFIHFSDIHNQPDRWVDICEFMDYYHDVIPFAIHTGDYVGASQASYTDLYSVKKPSSGYILNCVGNHDTYTSYPPAVVDPDPATAKSLLFTDTSDWGVTFGSADDAMYYYKDFADAGIRLIVLDQYYWDATEEAWFENLLTEARTSETPLAVVTASHDKTAALLKANRVDTSFNCYDVFEAPPAGAASGETIDHVGDPPIDSIIKTFKDAGGEHICHLCGHYHHDIFGYSANDILNISIGCATPLHANWNDTERVAGTKGINLFNVVSFDRSLHTIRLVRIGNSYDYYGRARNVLCYDYQNKSIITNS